MNRKAQRILLLVAVFVAALSLMGAGDVDDARFKRLGHAMMCTCGCNQILLECNHVGCSSSTQMSAELKDMVLKGQGDKQIRDAFVAKYGMTVLAAPTTSGFNRVAWIMPFVIFALALGAVVVVVRTWKLRQKPLAAAASATYPDSSAPEHLDELRRRAREETEL